MPSPLPWPRSKSRYTAPPAWGRCHVANLDTNPKYTPKEVAKMPIQPTQHIWMNGQLVPWDQAQIHVLTHTLHYGMGVFEGIRA